MSGHLYIIVLDVYQNTKMQSAGISLQQISLNAVQRRSEAGNAELARAVPGYA
jgi:hypothetical protein